MNRPSRYSMLIQWSDEDNAFVVTLPEFDGCRTHGESYEEAVKHGLEVLDLLMETYGSERRPLPPPEIFASTTS